MKTSAWILSLLFAAATSASADSGHGPLQPATFSTLITTPLAIEGLTNDDDGNLYTPGRAPAAADPCPVYKVGIDSPSLTVVGTIPPQSPACSPSGLAFGPDGQLYVASGDKVWRFMPNATTPPAATVFASAVPGTNGLAFDWNGNLWTGDGTTGVGRVWMITPAAAVTEVFRIQPMANEVNLVAGVGGIGRDVRTLGPGTITVTPTSRNAANTAGSQSLVANGVAFDLHHNLFVADTARGAIWMVHLRNDGTPVANMGCDTTFTANTLCMSQVFVAHPLLEGVDGIVLDVAGNIWAAANERNAVVLVRDEGRVVEVFRNPVDPGTQLRNGGPLETPTSPVLAGRKFCTANSDGNRRDNFPNTAGEIGGAGQPRGKISCLDQRAAIRGVRLPIH